MLPQDSFDPSAMDMGQANDLLAQFGQHMPEHPAMNAFLPNTGFFGDHPRVSSAIESGLLGAMNATNGPTTGDTISGAIHGMLGGVMQRRQMLNRQFETPFNNARMVGELQHLSSQRAEDTARIRLQNSQADYYDQRPDIEQNKIDAANDRSNSRIQATRPILGEGGAYTHDSDDPNAPMGGWGWHPGFGPGKPQPKGSFDQQAFEASNGERPIGNGKNSKGLTSKQWGDRARDAIMGEKTAAAGVSASHADARTDNANLKDGVDKEYKNYVPDPKMKRSQKISMFGHMPTPDEEQARINAGNAWHQQVMSSGQYISFPDYMKQQQSTKSASPIPGVGAASTSKPASGISDDQFNQVLNALTRPK